MPPNHRVARRNAQEVTVDAEEDHRKQAPACSAVVVRRAPAAVLALAVRARRASEMNGRLAAPAAGSGAGKNHETRRDASGDLRQGCPQRGLHSFAGECNTLQALEPKWLRNSPSTSSASKQPLQEKRSENYTCFFVMGKRKPSNIHHLFVKGKRKPLNIHHLFVMGKRKPLNIHNLFAMGERKPSNIHYFFAMGERKPSNIHHCFAM